MEPPRRVAIVPHTHWDREWYEPFQEFRMRLVDAVDALLTLMEEDPGYSRYLLDGQLAAVDDYLEVRPHNEERLRALAVAGRLAVGPWYTLMDEFLVSGETIVRDLQMGLARGASFGGAMRVGYLPDMFGHIGQMPQILRQAGIEHAVVWRGVPSTVTATAFTWEAPDGSTVRAEYLPLGYSNGALLPDDAKALVRRVEALVGQLTPFLVGDLLVMNGSDHLPPQPRMGHVVAEANAIQQGLRFEIVSLPDYLAGAPSDGLPRWQGELRSGARANMLMGVTSNRVDVKGAAASAERALERRAEPYAALFLPAASWPGPFLDIAWKQVVRNAAHDSICACSVDAVVDAVLHRYAEATSVADGVSRRALGALASSMADAGPVVVNPSARARSGLVELVVQDDGGHGPDGGHGHNGGHGPEHEHGRSEAGAALVQTLSERAAMPGTLTLDGRTARTVLGMIEGAKVDDDAWVQNVQVGEDDTGIDVTVTIGATERPDLQVAGIKQELLGRIAARPDVSVRVQLDQAPIRRVLAHVADVPGFGWQTYAPVRADHPVAVEVDEAGGGRVTLANGLVTVVVDPATGTFGIDGVGGMGRLVDMGDLGDSYNYSPPAQDSVVDTPGSVSLSVTEGGPLRARCVIGATYTWPDRVDGASQQRVGERRVDVTTTVDVRADDRAVRVTTTFVNPSRDHRLRVHLPLPRPASASEAECAFATVERGLTAEGRPDEVGLPTFPARRFVRAGGLTLVHDGVVEYELVDLADGEGGPAAHTLAFTVLRSTGMLSRLGMSYRPFPAGPLTPVEGLQLLGKTVEARYALVLGDDVDPWAAADDVLVPLEVVTSLGGGWRPPSGSALEVTGAEVTAVRRAAGALEVRVHNPSAECRIVSFGARSGWRVDLRGCPLEPFDGAFELRPHGIATVRLREG